MGKRYNDTRSESLGTRVRRGEDTSAILCLHPVWQETRCIVE